MKSLSARCLPGILLLLLAANAHGAEADNDPWAAFRFLIGEWKGEGSGRAGEAAGRLTFQPELKGKILVRRGSTGISRGLDLPAAIHEDLLVIYPAEQGRSARAISWDHRGHAVAFEVQPGGDGKSLTLLSEPGAGPRYRLSYTSLGKDRLAAVLAIAPAGQPEDFQTHLEAKMKRTPRSEVGLSLPRGYVCYRAAEPITVDGKLDEAPWRNAPWTEPFLDIEGDLKPVPRLETRAKMLWDDESFYVAAYLEEPHVWGTLTKHDSVIFQDNDFEIFIDPDGDNHKYYEIEINALNTEWDLFLKQPYRDGGPAVNEWEIPGLKTGVHVLGTLNDARDRDRGWTIEFAIPWKVLAEYAHRPTPPRDGDQWRVNFSRVEWEHEIREGKYAKVPQRREDNWIWSPQGFVDMHRPEYWGFVQFSTAPPGAAVFRPDPFQTIRERLIDVYHAQREYQKAHRRWANQADLLGLDRSLPGLSEHALSIQVMPDGFEATIRWQPPGSPAKLDDPPGLADSPQTLTAGVALRRARPYDPIAVDRRPSLSRLGTAMSEAEREDSQSLTEMIEADAMALGRKVLGREPTDDEADALISIFRSTAQALSEGFIRRLADHVLAERREESIEEFFEGHVKAD